MQCPYCKEEIQEGAIKCKHCGSMLNAPVTHGISTPSMPSELKKWNWAAFLWGPIWAIGHSVWIGLLGFIPFLALIISIVLGIKGNQWAWEKGNYTSVEGFKLKQKKWLKAWFIIVGFLGGGALILAISISAYEAYQKEAAQQHERTTEDEAQKGIATSSKEQITITGTLDAGTLMSNITTSDGKVYAFVSESEVADKIFETCKIEDLCAITGIIEDDQIVSVSTVKKLS